MGFVWVHVHNTMATDCRNRNQINYSVFMSYHLMYKIGLTKELFLYRPHHIDIGKYWLLAIKEHLLLVSANIFISAHP